jgi:membrane-associated phospholipid phosphatase
MKNTKPLESSENNSSPDSSTNLERRKFLGNLGKAAASAVAIGAAAPSVLAQKKNLSGAATTATATAAPDALNPTPGTKRRAVASHQFRADMALENYERERTVYFRYNNGDENLYPNRISNYSKGLPHQANGEVVPSAYNSFLNAIQTGKPADFEAIPMGGDRKLTNPQAGLAFDLQGTDACAMIQQPAPAFASGENGAEIAENYWMALLRDIPFTEYAINPVAFAAARDLTLFGADFKGPRNGFGVVTPDQLFRGLTVGDALGPYMSQFWYLPCNFGANPVSQKIRTVLGVADGGRDYMTDFESWLAIQNGVSPTLPNLYDPVLRYMRNGRDLGEWVHIDVLFQGYFQAFLVLAGSGMPFDSGNPYANSATQAGFATFGGPHIATLLCEISTRALKAVWNQKWFVHRRQRPEVFAARVHRKLYDNADYPIHSEILTSLSTQSRLGGFMPQAGNALLPQAFPEGSPTHPAYGAGHATVAGACVTILKAWFNESAVIQNPVVPNADGTALVPYTGSENLTVGGELNKIASNVALGRNMAGVHWRSDATESLKLGEAIAISVLRDQKACYNEQFDGFSLTKFDGTTVTV